MRDDETADKKPTDEEIYGELARRLQLAYVSCTVRLAYATVDRRYRRDTTPPGPYWIAMAKQVTEDMTEDDDDGIASDDPISRDRGDN